MCHILIPWILNTENNLKMATLPITKTKHTKNHRRTNASKKSKSRMTAASMPHVEDSSPMACLCTRCNRHLAQMQKILESGYDPNARGPHGMTPMACIFAHRNSKLCLEDADDDDKVEVKGGSKSKSKLSSSLIEDRALGPLSYAKTRLLLEYGADPNIPDDLGFTPMHLIAGHASSDKIRMDILLLLLKHGGLIDQKDDFGSDAYDHAKTRIDIEESPLGTDGITDVDIKILRLLEFMKLKSQPKK